MNKFIEIKNEKQLDEFLDDTWNFHDSVISEIKFTSGSFGSHEGTYPFDSKRELIMKLECVYHNNESVDAVELKFDNLIKAFISPCIKDGTTNIMGASIVLKDNKFIFVNDNYIDMSKIVFDEEFYYYISAEKLSYRFLNNQN